MTRRERLERKAEKRRQWAESRQRDAAQHFDAAHAATEHIPLGQPILVGHHSEKRHRAAIARSDSNMRAGCESAAMAKHHEQKADGIERQLERSVFSDDPDAVEALQAKIAEAEAFQAQVKADNAKLRKAKLAPGLPDLRERLTALGISEWSVNEILTLARVCRYHVEPFCKIPTYSLSNRNANIRRMKQRIEEIKARAERSAKAESAGGVSVENFGDYVRVTFAEKPDRCVLDALKAAGFRWGAGSWHGRRDALPAGVQSTEEAT